MPEVTDASGGAGVRPVVPALSSPLTRRGLRLRRFIKRFLYTQVAIRQAVMVALGREQPFVPFTVLADPPSVYFVWKIRDELVEELPQILGLPSGSGSTPMRVLETDEPAHLLTLNVYQVRGIANGTRAEWSMFVEDAEGDSRYMVVAAASSEVSMDPVEVITPKSHVTHSRDGDRIRTEVGTGDSAFTATIDANQVESAEPVVAASEWTTANDFIFWGNGVCDRTFYDAGLAHPDQVVVDPISLTDNTPWAALVEDSLHRVLVFRDEISFVVSPWENLGRIK